MKLQDLIEETEFRTFSYSGRGMFGKQCLAAEIPQLNEFLSELIGVARNAQDPTELDDALETIQEALLCLRTDTLGHNYVVYFPSIPFGE